MLGVNQSVLHWDMVCDLRSGSEICVDDQLLCKDGVFVVWRSMHERHTKMEPGQAALVLYFLGNDIKAWDG